MFTRLYKTHIGTLVLGLVFVFAGYYLPKVLEIANLHMILQGIAVLLFVTTMVCYYKIISHLYMVTDITRIEMWLALILHSMTLVAMFLVEFKSVFGVLFLSSLLIRKHMHIMEIDREMKQLCEEFDLALFTIGKEQESEYEAILDNYEELEEEERTMQLVYEKISDCQRYKVEVLEKNESIYDIWVLKYDETCQDYVQIDSDRHLTDSLEQAICLADEFLEEVINSKAY